MKTASFDSSIWLRCLLIHLLAFAVLLRLLVKTRQARKTNLKRINTEWRHSSAAACEEELLTEQACK